MKTIQVTYSVQIPDTPSFLRLQDGSIIPIEAITEEKLKEIGREWTEALIKKAKDKKGR